MSDTIDIFDTINNKYRILKQIGSGVYGKIYKVKDEKEYLLKAMKVNKTEQKYKVSIKIEKSILEELNLLQIENEELVPILYETVTFKKHICFIMKLYDINLYKFQIINYNNDNYNNSNFIAKFIYSIHNFFFCKIV